MIIVSKGGEKGSNKNTCLIQKKERRNERITDRKHEQKANHKILDQLPMNVAN